MNLRAPAKLNLCLFVGPKRGDGLHEIASVFLPLSLSDRLLLSESDADEVACEGVEGPNLVETALAGLRSRGWKHPPLRVEIEKRIPVAAGLGGGSADAGALLRYAAGEVADLDQLALSIGADVPSQLEPRPLLVAGAGEVLEPLPRPDPFAVVLVPHEPGLGAGEVYAEADRLGSVRTTAELERARSGLGDAVVEGWSPDRLGALLANDLEPVVRALRPGVEDALQALSDAGAAAALVTGSGPTAFGIFADVVAADRAAAALPPRFADPIVATVAGEGI